MKKIIRLGLVLLLCIGVSACGKTEPDPPAAGVESEEPPQQTPGKDNVDNTQQPQATEEPVESPAATQEPQNIVTDKAEIVGMASEIRQKMTLEEKIGQLFIVNFEQLDTRKGKSYDFTKVTATMREALIKYKPGGVVFFSRNIETPKQTKKFVDKLQSFSAVPLFVSVDEEGGEVARIAGNKAMNTTVFPTMREIGEREDEQYAYDMGRTIGSEIKALGFNLDFAPVADVRTNAANTEIGSRSFGDDPKLVAKMVAQVVKGLQEENVSATLKHFPGQGDTDKSSHEGAVDIDSDINELRKVSFVPFKAGIKAGADMIMVSHISISSVTGTIQPASMTELVMKDILRTELAFDGVIITDAMDMKSVTNYYTAGEAAVSAISAGADIVLMPENFKAACNAVLHAVLNGELEEGDIDDCVQRILELKIKRGIITADTPLLALETKGQDTEGE